MLVRAAPSDRDAARGDGGTAAQERIASRGGGPRRPHHRSSNLHSISAFLDEHDLICGTRGARQTRMPSLRGRARALESGLLTMLALSPAAAELSSTKTRNRGSPTELGRSREWFDGGLRVLDALGRYTADTGNDTLLLHERRLLVRVLGVTSRTTQYLRARGQSTWANVVFDGSAEVTAAYIHRGHSGAWPDDTTNCHRLVSRTEPHRSVGERLTPMERCDATAPGAPHRDRTEGPPMFPTRDVMDAATTFYDLEHIRGWILDEIPALEGRLHHGDTDPYLTLDLAQGGRIVIGKMTTGMLTRWVVVTPGHPDPVVHEIESKEDYARIIRAAIDDVEAGAAAAE